MKVNQLTDRIINHPGCRGQVPGTMGGTICETNIKSDRHMHSKQQHNKQEKIARKAHQAKKCTKIKKQLCTEGHAGGTHA